MDKRIIKTRQSIKNAFMQLTLNKEAGKLSVTDITEKAGINRSTFYLHYADVKSIAEDIDKEFAKVIEKCLDGFDITDIHGSIYSLFSYLTATLDKEETSKNYIIFSTESVEIAEKLKNMLSEKAKEAIISAFHETDTGRLTIPLNYAASGIVDSYVKWARAGESSKQLEKLVKTVSEITDYIIENLTINRRA